MSDGDDLSDNAILLDAVTGETLHTFDLSTKNFVPAVFPHSVVVAPGGRAWISLWNSASVIEIDLDSGKLKRRIPLAKEERDATSSAHATAMVVSPRGGHWLYVALSSRDEVVVFRTDTGAVVKRLSTAAKEGMWDTRAKNRRLHRTRKNCGEKDQIASRSVAFTEKLPLTVEGVVSMLACARLGAIHSVVYAGLGHMALRDRITDAEAKVIGECGHAHKALGVIADRLLMGGLNIPREGVLGGEGAS